MILVIILPNILYRYFMIKKNIFAFTLVELIVTVAILIILSTIGMITYLDFVPGVRDASRIKSVKRLGEAMEEYKLNSKIPKPENYVEIKVWSKLIWWQWEMWEDQIKTIGWKGIFIDPYDDLPYSYYLLKNRKSYQLLYYTEESVIELDEDFSVVDTTYAIEDEDYDFRVAKVHGSWIWIYVNDVNKPIHRIDSIKNAGVFDLANLGTQEFTSVISTRESIIWSGSNLISSLPNFSCKRIKQSQWNVDDGNYTITLDDTTTTDVYCDMTTQGGGWTLVHKTTDSALNLSWAVDTNEGYPNWQNDGEYRLSTDYWVGLSTQAAMAKNTRVDGREWDDISKWKITSIWNSGIDFTENDPYRIFGWWVSNNDAVGTLNSIPTLYWNVWSCDRCVNFDNASTFGFPNNSPMIRSNRTSYQWSAIEWAWGTNDGSWHRLSKMWIFLR